MGSGLRVGTVERTVNHGSLQVGSPRAQAWMVTLFYVLLHWVLLAARGLSLVTVSRRYSRSAQASRFGGLPSGSTGSVAHGLQ